MTKRFLLLASRPEDAVAEDELASILRLGGLRPEELEWMRLDQPDARPEHLDLDDYAGVILGGSPFTVSSPEEEKGPVQRRVEAALAAILAEVRRRDLPFLGLCYGVGTLATQAGGAVDGTYAEGTGAVEVRLTDAGRRDPLLHGVPGRFTAYVGHKEACSVLPPGAVLLAASDACPVQMFRLGDNQYVTQFHPEMDQQAIITRIEAYRYAGYFPAAEIDQVIARVSAADVSASHDVLRAFIRRYRARAAGRTEGTRPDLTTAA